MKSNIEHQSDGFTIVQGATTVALRYDGDHQRATQTTGTATTTYENDPASRSMEEVQAAGTTYTYQDYLKVDGHIVALRSCTASSFAACTATPSWTYFVTDQLGSTAVVTDASGTPIERDSTDPWGRPRIYATGADDASCGTVPPSATTHHFTGHESIASACVINANARLYDPTIGRFLAADTMVSDAFDGQAFNHFSYVNNGPLSATDPSGHMPTETITDTGTRIPGLGDTSDMPSGIVTSGGRGTAGSGYGATVRVALAPRLVPVTVTGTRIPKYRLQYVPVLIITEQGENSDSNDTDAADNAAGSDNNEAGDGSSANGPHADIEATAPHISARKYRHDIAALGLSLDFSVPSDVQDKIRSILNSANDGSTDGAGSKAMEFSAYTLILGYEYSLMRYYVIDGRASAVFTGSPGTASYITANVGDAGPGAVFELHPHFSADESLPSISDLLTSAKDGIPGVIVVPSGRGSQFIFYQGHCLDHSKGC
jgi:RHS repeat-associated protein